MGKSTKRNTLLLFLLPLTIIVATRQVMQRGSRSNIAEVVEDRGFNFLTWELDAFRKKIYTAIVSGHTYLDAPDQNQLVLDYVQEIGEVRQLDRDLENVYATADDPAKASQTLQADLAQRRADLAPIQQYAEAVLEDQTAQMLRNQRFTLAGQTFPPVQMHITPLPSMLIVSPRDDIRQQYAFPLKHGLPTPEKELLETAVFENEDLSALVVPIGGLGVFPAMIVETSNMRFLTDVFAHEWAHHWLSLRPLGVSYARNSELRTMNETVASILGEEIGLMTLQTYYPDLVPPPPPEPTESESDGAEEAVSEPPAFEFRDEMRITREETDRLIAEDMIEEAEAYMEARRLVFVENGYNIRKLNQAYFAFYGAYADSAGASGGDPVGPAVVAVREDSADLRDFMKRVAGLTNFEGLEDLLEE